MLVMVAPFHLFFFNFVTKMAVAVALFSCESSDIDIYSNKKLPD